METKNYNEQLAELGKIFAEMENAIIWCISELRMQKEQILSLSKHHATCHTEEADAQKSENSTRYPAEE